MDRSQRAVRGSNGDAEMLCMSAKREREQALPRWQQITDSIRRHGWRTHSGRLQILGGVHPQRPDEGARNPGQLQWSAGER